MKNLDYKWIALSCTSIGSFMYIFNTTAFIIAIPSILIDLQTSFDVILWTLLSFILIITIFVPIIGRVADIAGRKKLFIEGLFIYTIGSFLSGISINGELLIVFRIIQSFGAVLIISNTIAIITDAFPKKELGSALGYNTMVFGMGAILGPILGGALTLISWRFVFFINIPIGILGIIWAQKKLHEIKILPKNQKFDWKGMILFTLGLLILLLGCTFGAFLGWLNPLIILSFIIPTIFLGLFIYFENSSNQPMLDLRLFKNRYLSFALLANLMNGVARGAITFLLVLYYQGIKSLDPLIAGILLTPFSASMFIISPFSGKFSDKYGSRILSTAGLVISAFGLIGFVIIGASTSILISIIWLLIIGFGSGLFFAPITNKIMGSVPPGKRGMTAGTRTMMVNLGTIISLAITLVAISSAVTSEALQGLFTGTHVGSEGINIFLFMQGLHIVFLISFIFSLVGALLSSFGGQRPVWNEEIPNNNTDDLSKL